MIWLRFLPYGVAALCVIAALVFWNGWTASAGRADAADLRASAALAQNRADADTIARITAARAADDALLKSLSANYEIIVSRQAAQTAKIEELARTNVEVSEYLSRDLPDDLRRVLDSPDDVRKDDDRNGTATGNDGRALPKADRVR